MENYQKLLHESYTLFKNADHLTYVTYPAIRDPNMLLTITKNIYLSLILAAESLLHYERRYRRLLYVPTDVQVRIELFKKCADKYNIPRSMVFILEDLRAFLQQHERSSVVLKKNHQLIVYSQNYKNMRTLSIDKVKEYLATSKKLLFKVDTIVK